MAYSTKQPKALGLGGGLRQNAKFLLQTRRMFQSLPLNSSPSGSNPKRVCIATPDIFGPIRNGGIGTAFLGLAEVMNEAGIDVTILFSLGAQSEDGDFESWVEFYRERGIHLHGLEMRNGLSRFPVPLQRSWSCYEWLKTQKFDCVFFAEWGGLGFYSLMAKSSRLAFDQTLLIVNTHAPTMWARIGNKKLIDDPVLLLLDFLERQSVENADFVISPSRHILEWMQKEEWSLPSSSYVQPNCIGSNSLRITSAEQRTSKVDELVFFGRLEPRKGIVEFCGALDRLNSKLVQTETKVTFLGKDVAERGGFNSDDFLKDKAKNWDFEWQKISAYDSAGAINYLQSDGRLAVIPSLNDNSPMTIIECISNRIPFIASRVGGIPELIAPADHDRSLFAPFIPDLTKQIRLALETGAKLPEAAWDEEETKQQWLAWLRTLDVERASSATDSSPTVSVCLLHYNRPEALKKAVSSIVAQDYPSVEVILADDGSTDPEALEYLELLGAAHPDWNILRMENRFRGAARNSAARAASGKYLLFLDDDNFLSERAITTWVKAAESLQGDICTSIQFGFDDVNALPDNHEQCDLILHVGGARAYGVFRNGFGDMNCLIRRSVYEDLGGLNETYGFGHEDWEFFSRAVLNGYRIQCVPAPLVWYQRDANKYVRLRHVHPAYMLNNIKPYCDTLPADLKSVVLLAQGHAKRLPEVRGELNVANRKLKLEVEKNADVKRQIQAQERANKQQLDDIQNKHHKQLESLRQQFDLERREILSSTSWRLTAPIRYVGKLLRGAN